MLLIATAMLVIREQDAYSRFLPLWPVAGWRIHLYGGNDGDCRSAAILRWKLCLHRLYFVFTLPVHWPLMPLPQPC